MFETVFFLECPGMSQPLDSATPGRPPKVPFFWQERNVFVFLGEKNCACGSFDSIVQNADVLRGDKTSR